MVDKVVLKARLDNVLSHACRTYLEVYGIDKTNEMKANLSISCCNSKMSYRFTVGMISYDDDYFLWEANGDSEDVVIQDVLRAISSWLQKYDEEKRIYWASKEGQAFREELIKTQEAMKQSENNNVLPWYHNGKLNKP